MHQCISVCRLCPFALHIRKSINSVSDFTCYESLKEAYLRPVLDFKPAPFEFERSTRCLVTNLYNVLYSVNTQQYISTVILYILCDIM